MLCHRPVARTCTERTKIAALTYICCRQLCVRSASLKLTFSNFKLKMEAVYVPRGLGNSQNNPVAKSYH